jgi:hypothetical protein
MCDWKSIAAVCITALASAAILGGRYQAVGGSGGDTAVVYVVDRFTGDVRFCVERTCASTQPLKTVTPPAPNVLGPGISTVPAPVPQ